VGLKRALRQTGLDVIIQRNPDVTSETVDGQAVLIAPEGDEIITLNPVGTLVWDALVTARDVDGLTDHLLAQLVDVERDELHGDVVAFLGELRDSGLIEERE
jgi:hypothetical protein